MYLGLTRWLTAEQTGVPAAMVAGDGDGCACCNGYSNNLPGVPAAMPHCQCPTSSLGVPAAMPPSNAPGLPQI
eukprot:scaffold6488_cov26-Tisochrysis_lutea.AAC.2